MVDFSHVDFTLNENENISFEGFELGNLTSLHAAKFGNGAEVDHGRAFGRNSRRLHGLVDSLGEDLTDRHRRTQYNQR